MMYDEFISRLPENMRELSRETFAEIEFVYLFYPGNLTKDEIAQLYTRHGMRIIQDMLPRAKHSQDLAQQCDDARHNYHRAYRYWQERLKIMERFEKSEEEIHDE